VGRRDQQSGLEDMTDLGLVSVMPATAHLLLAALTVSFCAALYSRSVRPWVALVHVLVTLLYGVTAFLESEPRFSSVYRHTGIIDNLLGNRATDPTIDAYSNWPGSPRWVNADGRRGRRRPGAGAVALTRPEPPVHACAHRHLPFGQ